MLNDNVIVTKRCSRLRGRYIPLIVEGRDRPLVEYLPAIWQPPPNGYDDPVVAQALTLAQRQKREVKVLCPGAFWKAISRRINRSIVLHRLPYNVVIEHSWCDEEFDALWNSLHVTPLLKRGRLLIFTEERGVDLVRAIVINYAVLT